MLGHAVVCSSEYTNIHTQTCTLQPQAPLPQGLIGGQRKVDKKSPTLALGPGPNAITDLHRGLGQTLVPPPIWCGSEGNSLLSENADFRVSVGAASSWREPRARPGRHCCPQTALSSRCLIPKEELAKQLGAPGKRQEEPWTPTPACDPPAPAPAPTSSSSQGHQL